MDTTQESSDTRKSSRLLAVKTTQSKDHVYYNKSESRTDSAASTSQCLQHNGSFIDNNQCSQHKGHLIINNYNNDVNTINVNAFTPLIIFNPLVLQLQ